MFDFETVLRMELEHLDLFTRKSEVRGSKRLCQSNGWARVDYLVRFLIFFFVVSRVDGLCLATGCRRIALSTSFDKN